MNGNIYLIGGGEIAEGETRGIDEDIKSSAERGSTMVFFATAARDNGEYIETVTKAFGDYFNVVAVTKRQGQLFAKEALQTAGAVYLGGGKTEFLFDLFSAWDLVSHLRNAHERGAIIAGISAGAQALSAWYIDEDNDDMRIRRGWGFASLASLVHAHDASAQKAFKLVRESRINSRAFIAIGEKAAWRIASDGTRKIGEGTVWCTKNDCLDILTSFY